MFKSLSALIRPVVPPAPAEDITVPRTRLQVLQAARHYTGARCVVIKTMATRTGLNQDFADLRRLRQVIQTYGLNKSLMAFATPTASAARHGAKLLPSIESLDGVTLTAEDPRTQDTLVGLDDTIDTQAELVADWIRTGGDNVGALLDATAEQLQGVDATIEYYRGVLADRSDADASLAESTLVAIPHDQLLAGIEALLTVLPQLDAVLEDPTDRDAMDAQQAKLAEWVVTLSDCTNLAADPDNQHQLQLTDTTPLLPSSDSFAAHGYSVETMSAMLDRVAALVDAVTDLVGRKEAIVSQFSTAADRIVLIDNAVPPAIDPTALVDDDVDNAVSLESATCPTQVDVIHAHASSHLCCIAAVTDAALDHVRHALTVAGHVDQHPEATVPEPVPAPVPTPTPPLPVPASPVPPHVAV